MEVTHGGFATQLFFFQNEGSARIDLEVSWEVIAEIKTMDGL